jgi:hypothetical protein
MDYGFEKKWLIACIGWLGSANAFFLPRLIGKSYVPVAA